MENPIQDLEFLDLSNINESEKHQLQTVLYAPNPNARYPELPWCGGSMPVLHIVEPPPPPLDWMSNQQYAEGEEQLLNGTGEEEEPEECLEEAPEEDPPSAAHEYPGAPAAQAPPVSGAPAPAPVYPPPFSHVYVNNMTANVSVHGYMHGAPVAGPHPPPPSFHQMPNPMYATPTGTPTQEVPAPSSGGQKKRYKGNSNSGASRRLEHSQPQPTPLEVPPHHPQHPGPMNYPFPGAPAGNTPPGYYPMYFHHHGPPQHAQTGSPLYLPPPHPHSMYHPQHHHHAGPPPPQTLYYPPPPHHSGIPPVSHVEETMQQQQQSYMVSQQQHHMDQQQQHHHHHQHKSPHHHQNHQVPVSQHQHNVSQHQQQHQVQQPQVNVKQQQPITTMSSAQPVDSGHRQVQLNGDAEEWQGRNGNRNGQPEEIVEEVEQYQEEEEVEEGEYQDEVEENYVAEEEVNNTEQDQFEDSTTLGDAQSTSLNSSLSSSGPAPQVPASSPPQSAGPEKAKEPVVESVSEVTAPVSSEAIEAQAPETKDTTIPSTPPVAVVAPGAPKTWASLLKKSDDPSGSQSGFSSSAASPGLSKPCARVEPLTTSYNSYQSSTSNVTPSPRYNNTSSSSSGPNASSGSQATRSGGPGPRSSGGYSDDAVSQNLGKLLLNTRLDHKGISLMPRGLINKSNYCYINATLQALIACPPFYNLLRAINKQRGGYANSRGHYTSNSGADSQQSTTPIFNAMLQLANEFSYLQLAPGGGSASGRNSGGRRYDDQDLKIGAPFAPTYVYQILASIKSDSAFNVEGRQEDAEEFLTFLLNGLNDEMLELVKSQQSPKEPESNTSNISAVGKQGKTSSSPRAPGLSNGDVVNGDLNSGDADDGDWKEVTKDSKNKGAIVRRHTSVSDKTPVSEIFRGQVRTRVTRVSDSTVTENIQPFFTLALDIEKVNSVKEALDLLVLREGLEGVTSTKTNQETEAYQTVTIDELPFVLLLHLKCFDYRSHTCQKIMKSLEFPVLLNLEPKLLSNAKSKKPGPNAPNGQKNKQYKLFAVVYHDGKEASKGHYITDVFHVGYSGWIRYDDANVRFVSESEVLHSKPPRVPYILYYRRADTIVSKNLSPTS